jgi:hypothetical protein
VSDLPAMPMDGAGRERLKERPRGGSRKCDWCGLAYLWDPISGLNARRVATDGPRVAWHSVCPACGKAVG